MFRWMTGISVAASRLGTISMKKSQVLRSTPPNTHCKRMGRPCALPSFLRDHRLVDSNDVAWSTKQDGIGDEVS